MIVLPAERKFHRLVGIALPTFLTTFSIQAGREVEAISIRKLFLKQSHSFVVGNVSCAAEMARIHQIHTASLNI